MSDGRRSGVNWIRLKQPPKQLASDWAREVFPMPGGPSIRAWPLASSAVSSSVEAWSEPRTVSVRRSWSS